MAAIYKRSQDESKKRAVWYIGYTDHRGKRCTVKGFTDRGATERLAAKLEHEAMLRKRGLIDPDLEQFAQRRTVPVAQHLTAFETSLGKNSPKHVKLTMSRVRKIVDGCGFKTAAEITIEVVEAFLQQFAKDEDIGNRTYNHYVQALDEFCTWLVTSKRLAANPVLGIERLNSEIDVRHRRRALAADEVGKLIDSARKSGESIQCFDGETRARIYILSYLTGLRRNELGSLSPQSFDIDSAQPTVTVEAAFSKHRRRDVLPLHPALIPMIREWIRGLSAEERLFPKLGRRRTWLMVKKDLERIGIAYETADGIADFHAAGRHSHITELIRSGATLPQAKELARHSDIKMTMRYTHIGMADQADALRKLPWGGGDSPSRTNVTRIDTPKQSDKSWERIGSEPGVSACHNGASGDTGESPPPNDATPVGDRGCRQKSLSGSDCQKWRRRELNPRPAMCRRKLLRA